MRAVAVAILVVLTACGSRTAATSSNSPVMPTASSRSPSSPSPSAHPTVAPTPSPVPAPRSAGVVPASGVLYVWGADDGIYRYDGATGAVTRVWGASSLDREMADGAYVLGRHGGITLLKWDGSTVDVCAGGGFADVSVRRYCAFRGAGADNAVYTDSPEGGDGAPLPRKLLPSDWGAAQFAWDSSGLQLAIIRYEARPEPVRAHETLWVMDIRHGTLRRVFDSPSDTSILTHVAWSPLTNRIAFLEQTSTSQSFAADGVGTHLWVVDPASGARTDLGNALSDGAWFRWSSDGRLAFVRGGGRETWDAKEIVVLGADGTEHVVAGALSVHPTASDRAAIAPAWQPVSSGARLAWIEGPAATIEASHDYSIGIGPAAQRVAVLDGTTRISCPDRVTEGVRWSADGSAVLLLCRVADLERGALEIWYAPLRGTPQPLVTGLGNLGFGFYGMQPSLFDLAAWSLADR